MKTMKLEISIHNRNFNRRFSYSHYHPSTHLEKNNMKSFFQIQTKSYKFAILMDIQIQPK